MISSYLVQNVTGIAALLCRPAPAAHVSGRDSLVMTCRFVMSGPCLDLYRFRVIAGASISTACLEMGRSIARYVGSASIADASHLLVIYRFVPIRRILYPALLSLRNPVMHVFRLAAAAVAGGLAC